MILITIQCFHSLITILYIFKIQWLLYQLLIMTCLCMQHITVSQLHCTSTSHSLNHLWQLSYSIFITFHLTTSKLTGWVNAWNTAPSVLYNMFNITTAAMQHMQYYDPCMPHCIVWSTTTLSTTKHLFTHWVYPPPPPPPPPGRSYDVGSSHSGYRVWGECR